MGSVVNIETQPSPPAPHEYDDKLIECFERCLQLSRAGQLAHFSGVIAQRNGEYITKNVGELTHEQMIGRLEVLKAELLRECHG